MYKLVITTNSTLKTTFNAINQSYLQTTSYKPHPIDQSYLTNHILQIRPNLKSHNVQISTCTNTLQVTPYKSHHQINFIMTYKSVLIHKPHRSNKPCPNQC